MTSLEPPGPPIEQPKAPKNRRWFVLAFIEILIAVVVLVVFWPRSTPPASRPFPRPAPPARGTPASTGPTPPPPVKALAGMIQVDEGVILAGSTQPPESEQARDAVLVGVSSDGSLEWTRLVETDPWYIHSAPSRYGPTLMDGYRVEVLDDVGETAEEGKVPSSHGYPTGFAWMGDTLLVVANPDLGPGSINKTKATLFALGPGGKALWSAQLPQGFPEIVGGTSSAYVTIQRGKNADVYRIDRHGLAEGREFNDAFPQLAQMPWGLVVATSDRANVYRFLDEKGHEFLSGQIPHSEGWLTAVIPLGDRVAILTNGEDYGTMITVVDRDGTEQQFHVSSSAPLGVWASPTGIFVAGTLTESDAVPLIDEITLLEFELEPPTSP